MLYPLTYITFVAHTPFEKQMVLSPYPSPFVGIPFPLSPILFWYLFPTFLVLGALSYLYIFESILITIYLLWVALPPKPHSHFLHHHTMALCPRVPFVKGPFATLQLGSSLCSCMTFLSKAIPPNTAANPFCQRICRCLHLGKSLLPKDLQHLSFVKRDAMHTKSPCPVQMISQLHCFFFGQMVLFQLPLDLFQALFVERVANLGCLNTGMVCHQHLWSHTCTASRVAS